MPTIESVMYCRRIDISAGAVIKDKRLLALTMPTAQFSRAQLSRPLRAPRADNRLPRLLDEAARLFGTQGFHGTSVRDIVRTVDMLPGSLYYHFATKEDLLAAVYAEGVRRICERTQAAVDSKTGAWARLEVACIA